MIHTFCALFIDRASRQAGYLLQLANNREST
jgi:hypothetical protein